MIRKTMLSLVVLAAMMAAPVAARADVADGLKLAPSSAPVTVVVSSFQSLAGKVNAWAKRLGLSDNLPKEGVTPDMLTQGKVKLEQLDQTKAIVLVITALPAKEENNPKVVALLPVKDFNKFVTDNNGQTKDGQTTFAYPDGSTDIVKPLGSYAALADDAAGLAAVEKPGKTVADVLGAAQKNLINGSEVYVHVNLPAVVAAVKPLIDDAAKNVPESDKNVMAMVNTMATLLGDEADAADIALAVPADGFELRAVLTAKPGSAMETALAAAKAPPAALITGVPVEGFLMLGGQAQVIPADNAFTKKLMDLVNKSGLPGAQNAKLQDLGVAAEKLVTAKSFVISGATKEGKLGLPIMLTQTAQTTDGAKALQIMRDYLLEAGKVMAAAAPAAPADPAAPAAPAANPIEIKQGAETLAGVSVDKITFTQETFKALGPMAAMLPQILGEDVSARMGAKGNTLILTIGGGTAGFEAAIKAADAKTGVEGLAGIAKVKPHLVDPAAGVLYVAADRIASIVASAVGGMMGAELPAFPKVEEPITFSAGIKDKAMQMQLYVPATLVDAVKKYVDDVQAEMQKKMQQPAAPDAAPSF